MLQREGGLVLATKRFLQVTRVLLLAASYLLLPGCEGPRPDAGAGKRWSHPTGGPVGGRECWRSVLAAAGVEWSVVRFWLERDRSPCRGSSGERPVRESRRGLNVMFEGGEYCVALGCWLDGCEADEVFPWVGRVALVGGCIVCGCHGRAQARGSIGYG